ncbi:MAG TPA: CHC2 zinc finger domain-containing protein, partial [Chondromyces sp.]|nr:CHC2 zinc finger domain-containing protein [Chondromyces sp.]
MIYQIKSTISLIDALERYTGEIFYNIRTNRSRFNIRCPFHNDRNPSFTVYMDTNTFRCWSGCNEGKPGDVIDFVRLFQNVDTKEAIKLLIDDYGLKNPDS